MDRNELKILEEAFIEGFRHASDKLAFLRLGTVPLERADGGKLVEVAFEECFEVGAVSPSFAMRGLVYHPLPNRLTKTRATLRFIYQSFDGRRNYGLAEILTERAQAIERPGHDHEHAHPHGHDHAGNTDHHHS